MSTKHKNRKLLTVLMVIMALFIAGIGGYLLYESLSAGEDADNSIYLISVDKADIVSLSYTHDGELIQFDLVDGVWVWADDAELALDQDMVGELVAAASVIVATRELDGADDAYGLAEPAMTLTVTTASEKTYRLNVGGQNPQTFEYYVTKNDSARVYTVASSYFDSFSSHATDLVSLDTIPAVLSSLVRSIKVERPSENLLLENFDGGLDYYDYSGTKSWLVTTSAGSYAASTSCAVDFIDAFTGMAVVGVAAYNIDDTALYTYGFDLKTARITMNYSVNLADGAVSEDRTYVMLIGTVVEDGYAFIMEEGSSTIYFVDTEDVEKFFDCCDSTLVSPEVCGIAIDYINSMTVTYNGKTAAVDVSSETTYDDEGAATVAYKYTSNGEQVDGESFINFFNSLRALTYQAEAENPVSDELLHIAFETKNTVQPKASFSLYAYDGSFYAASMQGETPLLINRRSIDEMIVYLETALEDYWR